MDKRAVKGRLRIAAIAVSCFSFGLFIVGPLVGNTHSDAAPCVAEDGPGPCYWDAQHRGNGEGTSFFMDVSGRIHHLDAFHAFPRGRGHFASHLNQWYTIPASADEWMAEAYNGPRVHEDFTRCAVMFGRETTFIICPDGKRFTS
jgi:hypothetical protein